jgi:predicted nucleotide-binding protein (sugar kinase/HSP70/actin superfamily)
MIPIMAGQTIKLMPAGRRAIDNLAYFFESREGPGRYGKYRLTYSEVVERANEYIMKSEGVMTTYGDQCPAQLRI